MHHICSKSEMVRTFSDNAIVRLVDPHKTGYLPSNLNHSITTTNLFDTYIADKSLGHNINYGLRACTQVLKLNEDTNKGIKTSLITIYFEQKSIAKLQDQIANQKNSLFTEISRRLIPKLKIHGIKLFYIVFELGKQEGAKDLSGLHAHIVALIDEKLEKSLKKQLRDFKYTRKMSTAVQIKYGYRIKISKRNKDTAEFVLGGINYRNLFEKSNSKKYAYITKDELPIDIGIADYLSKDLLKPLFFSRGSNFMVSKQLKKKALEFTSDSISKFKRSLEMKVLENTEKS